MLYFSVSLGGFPQRSLLHCCQSTHALWDTRGSVLHPEQSSHCPGRKQRGCEVFPAFPLPLSPLS